MKLKKIALPLALMATLVSPMTDYFAAPVEAAAQRSAAVSRQPLVSVQKLDHGEVTVYDYGNIRLHAYKTNDVLSDECYVVEGKGGLVLLESAAFKENVQEFDRYIKSLKKPLKGKLLSYHSNGYNTYADAPVYATEKALASWGENGGVTALTNNFVKTFGDTVDTNLPAKATIVRDGEVVSIAGIDFRILPTPDEDYSVEIPAINVVYRHMLGSKVHNILPSVDYIDAEIADMKNYQQAGYSLILTSHNVPEGQEAVREKLDYLHKVKELAFTSPDKDSFIENVKAAFPDYAGENYLEMSAGALFPEAKTLPAMQDSGSEADIKAIKDVISTYADSITNYDLAAAATIWQMDDRTTFIHPRGNEYGWNAIKDNFYGVTMHDTFSQRHLYIHDINVQVYGDTAVSVFYWDFPAVFRSDGVDITTHGRETQVYRRTGEGWKIVHVHYSNMPVTGAKAGF